MDSMKYARLCRRVVAKKDELNQSRNMAKYAINQLVLTSLGNLGGNDAHKDVIKAGSIDGDGKFLAGEFVEKRPTEFDFVLQVRVGLEDKYEIFYLQMTVIVEAGKVKFFCKTTGNEAKVPTNDGTMNRYDTMVAVTELLGPAVELYVDEYFARG